MEEVNRFCFRVEAGTERMLKGIVFVLCLCMVFFERQRWGVCSNEFSPVHPDSLGPFRRGCAGCLQRPSSTSSHSCRRSEDLEGPRGTTGRLVVRAMGLCV